MNKKIDKCGIYKIINTINQKIYVGSSKNINIRWERHKYDLIHNKHRNPHLQNSWNKYGENNFLFEIIKIVKDYNNLLKEEQFYLDALNPFQDNGFNICKQAAGGDNNANHPNKKEIYKKISKTKKEKFKNMSSEEKEIFLKRMQKENHPNYGHRYEKERKKRISERRKKYWADNPKLKKELSIKQLGEKNSFYGKKHSNKTKKIWAEQRGKKIIIDKEIYKSTIKASEILNISPKIIHYRLKANKYTNYQYY